MKLTKFELEIMDVLWSVESAAVREIQEKLPEKRRPAYTTVQTIINRLEEKGAARRVRKIGNAYIYQAAVTRRAAHRRLIDDFLDLFGGSLQPVISHLAQSGKLTLKDLRELENSLERMENDEKENVKSDASKSDKKRSKR